MYRIILLQSLALLDYEAPLSSPLLFVNFDCMLFIHELNVKQSCDACYPIS